MLWDTFLNALDDNNRRTEIEITDQMCWSACIMCNDWLTSKYLIARKAAKLPKVWHYWEAEQSHKNQFCLLSEEWLVLLRLIRVIPRQHFQVAARQYSRGSWHKGEWWPLEVAVQFCDCSQCSHKLQRRHLSVESIYKHWHFKTCMLSPPEIGICVLKNLYWWSFWSEKILKVPSRNLVETATKLSWHL